jgi:predicted nucleic acid-binding protein
MRLQKVPHRHLIDRAWELRDNVSFYDGLYVALAEALDAPLLTLDGKLSRASGLRTEVELIGEG